MTDIQSGIGRDTMSSMSWTHTHTHTHSNTVSRCGLLVALTNAIDCCKTEGTVDVFQAVKALRIQKPGSLCNVQQYQSIFTILQQFLNSFDIYSNFK
jgi:hypothetical protein